jgi:hypothetical protein
MRTGRVGYVEPLCGHAKSYLLSIYKESSHEEIPKSGIEVKVRSEDCLAKCVAVTRGKDTYF